MDERVCQTNNRKQRDDHRKSVPVKCGSFCCSLRPGISSSEEGSGSHTERVQPMSSLAHALVQERLDQLVRGRKKQARVDDCKCIVMIAMDKESYDPREDFRRSMMEVMASNRIEEPKELRCLLNCYMSINSEECRPIILEAFHEGNSSAWALRKSVQFI